MKICFLADGKSIHTLRWCSHFRERGHEVHLITFRDTVIDGVHVHYLPVGDVSAAGGNYRVMLKYPAVKRIIRKISPDIVHAMYATSYGWVGKMSGFHPFVLTALGTDVLISPFQSRMYKMLVKRVIRSADWITSMSDPMKDVLLGLGAKPERVDVVIFGIEPKIFNDTNRKVSQEHFVITSTRNMEPVYNIDAILSAIKKIHDQIPQIKVNLLGDGSLRPLLEKQSKEMGLGEVVRFLGRRSQPEIAEILNQSHVFISSSLSDGNNISLNEAMACGCYCIATDIPPNRVWIRNGENGALYKPGDAEELSQRILYVYKHYPQLQMAAIEQNKAIVKEKADWNVNMQRVEEMYRKLSGK